MPFHISCHVPLFGPRFAAPLLSPYDSGKTPDVQNKHFSQVNVASLLLQFGLSKFYVLSLQGTGVPIHGLRSATYVSGDREAEKLL